MSSRSSWSTCNRRCCCYLSRSYWCYHFHILFLNLDRCFYGNYEILRAPLYSVLARDCVIFASSRTFFFSGSLTTNLHGMVGCCTSCYILKFRGAAIILPVTQQYSLQRFVFLIRERPEERVVLASGDYDIIAPSSTQMRRNSWITLAGSYLSAAVTCKLAS